jgi:hypothetical protein
MNEITNDGNIVYKRTVLKQMNLGKSITKSVDLKDVSEGIQG